MEEKETFTKKEMQWLLDQAEKYQYRYMESEVFLFDLMAIPWWKRLFFFNRIIYRHLDKVMKIE